MAEPVYWGEIPRVSNAESGIAALEREQITRAKPMDVEGPLLHQPSSRHHPPTNEILSNEHFQMDPVVIHTIRLVQHIKKLRTAIDALQQDSSSESEYCAVGTVPEYDGPPIKDKSKRNYFLEEEYESDFARGIGKAPPAIDEITSRKLLRRSVAAICAHLSFDSTPESVLETLTDVCHEFLIQFMTHLGMAADRKAQHGNCGFPDIMERVFCDMGLGSVTSLHGFYQQRVLSYHTKMKQQCQKYMLEYSTLVKQPPLLSGHGTASPGGSMDTLPVIRIKEEPSTEIQFPLLDDNDDVNDAEQLLNIESLGTFEITVEHETASGLTTEVESKWSQNKGNAGEARSARQSTQEETTESTEQLNVVRTPQSNIPKTPQSNVPLTPQEVSVTTPRESNSGSVSQDDNVQESRSVLATDIFSPSAPTKKQKKK